MFNKHLMARIAVLPFLFAAALALSASTQSLAVEKEVSLVTGQPLGDLAVAGRLSIDLHAEFMLSRSFGTETALNWYNCGYSGGGRGGSTVGGSFGDFGFQIPYKEREQKYPHAVLVGEVSAVRFDGGDFLRSNIPIESQILKAGKMAVEVWLRCEGPSPGQVILGWQSVDGRESSASVVLPKKFQANIGWQHLVVNCKGQQEEWYLNGAKIGSGSRETLPKAGHVMVLGGGPLKANS